MDNRSSDRVSAKAFLRVPRSRAWEALTDSKRFGEWFGAELTGAFVPGATVNGTITEKGHEGMPFEMRIERVEREELFSWRWHPYAVDPAVDYSSEEPTLVEFRLREAPGGTVLTVVESGFDGIPEPRRAEARRMHEEGWAGQMKSIKRYLSRAA